MTGLLMRGEHDYQIISTAFELADEYMIGRKPESGIAAIKKRKKNVPES